VGGEGRKRGGEGAKGGRARQGGRGGQNGMYIAVGRTRYGAAVLEVQHGMYVCMYVCMYTEFCRIGQRDSRTLLYSVPRGEGGWSY
jgi:hypothetical protein